MKIKCKNCLPIEGIDIPELMAKEKTDFWRLRVESGLKLTKELLKNNRFSHQDAKFITAHLNSIPGKCNRCNFDQLTGEYTTCSRCGALNINWNIKT